MRGKQTNMADYFSRLPESVIHHILSFLRPFKEIGRTCVLSKYFNSVWNNYPHLDFFFNQIKFINREKALFDCIDNSLGQCLVRRPFIRQLRLQIFCIDEFRMTSKLNRKNAKRLKGTSKAFVGYSVPQQVFVARTLEVLDLTWCTLKKHRIVHIELPRLERLSLSNCRFVGKKLLQKILCGSPKIKHISLSRCSGLGNSLSVSCTPLLKRFSLRRDCEFKRIKIDAPSLHTLSYQSFNASCAIDLTSCTNLKELYLDNVADTAFEQLGSIFPVIQVLEANKYCLEKKHKISSPSLKRLVLHGSQRLNDIEIDAPNLHSFEFSHMPRMSSMLKFNSWSIPKTDDIHMKFSAGGFQEACREGIQDFLMKLPHYEDLKFLLFNSANNVNKFIMIKELHAVPFSSLQTLANNSSFNEIYISSRDETNLAFLLSKDYLGDAGSTLSMICSSWQSAEIICSNLRYYWSIVKDNYRQIELVTPADIQMCSTLDSFVMSNSGGAIHREAIIIHASKKSIQ